jgi:hypothetical protein
VLNGNDIYLQAEFSSRGPFAGISGLVAMTVEDLRATEQLRQRRKLVAARGLFASRAQLAHFCL